MKNFVVGLFSVIKGSVFGNTKKLETCNKYVLQSALICPNCGIMLKKEVKVKTKCKNCNEFIYKRTNPSNMEVVVCREEDALRIDMEWAEINNSDTFPSSAEEVLKEYEFKKMTPDQKWSFFNNQLSDQASKSDFEAMSHTYFEMARQVLKEGRLSSAVVNYVLCQRSKNEYEINRMKQMKDRYSEKDILETLKILNVFSPGDPLRTLEEIVPHLESREKIISLCNDISFSNNNFDQIMEILKK